MKKVYSFMLMAAALLISANAWAGNFSGNATQLQKAIADIIYGAESDPEIKLQNDVELNGTTIWVGTEKLSDPYKSITIDLNGHSITSNSQTATNRTLIALTHGELKIINTAANEATLGLLGNAADGATIVSVFGSYRSSRWNDEGTALVGEGTNTRVEGWCSHLEIGSNVKLYAEDGCQGTGLYIGTGTLKYPKDNNNGTYTLANTAYPVSVMTTSGWGFAHGVRVDFSGKIEFLGTNAGKAYGIKANGTTRSPLSCVNEKTADGDERINTNYTDQSKTTYIPYLANYYGHNAAINTEATLATDETHKRDTVDAPFIWIHPGAEVNVRDAGNKVTALYAAGYAKWLVQGYAEGKTGMYVSSGVLDLNDAYVKSTAAGWESSTSAGSANGGGSGVVLNSRSNYAGGVEFTVSGDTHIESIKGYAIEEIVNTTPVPNPKADPTNPEYDSEAPATIQVTKVANITIEGGTISGGDEGAIVVSTATLSEAADPNKNVEVVIYGGNVIGDSYAGDKGAVTTGDLSDLMPNTGYHTTEVTVTDPVDPTKTKTVIVISEGDAPDAPILGNMVSEQAEGASIKWTVNTKDTIKTDLKLAELEINTTDLAQELVIKENATLTVGRIVLGKDAKIIVEAGGKFIVTGKQGIVAPVAENIQLQASSTDQAVFLFNPNVTSNRHPNATIHIYTNAKQLTASPYTYTYQRFALPIMAGAAPTNDFSGEELFGGATTFRSYAWEWNGYKWENLTGGWNSLEPFKGYQLANNTVNGGVTYTFKGELVGNENAEYKFPTGGYDFFGSSHSAPIYIDSLFLSLAEYNVEPTVWIYNFGTSQYDAITSEWIGIFFDDEIKANEGFVLRFKGSKGTATLDYGKAIWGNPNMDAAIGRTRTNNAPARVRSHSTSNLAVINVTAENGFGDNVKLLEANRFSSEFDNGADASKFMSAEGINIYASTEAGELANVATDDLTGTLLSFRSGNSTSYTINITNVLGEDYALRDNVTGRVIALTEDATYTFTQNANTTAQARFEIVKVVNVMTAIDNVEEAAKATGIYTITGQYLGRDLTILPAGVYIVNGVKIVK